MSFDAFTDSRLAILACALVIDALIGEPRWLWSRFPHPAVLMGHAVLFVDQKMNNNRASPAQQRRKGMIALAYLVIGAGICGLFWSVIPLNWLWVTLAAAFLLAQKSLAQHVQAVAQGLEESLEAGRRKVAMIVGRDPQSLDEAGVSRAAIESAAENFSDGVIAPCFWFLVAGLPGLMIYKIVNTADSMIGHKTVKYRHFGYAAAKLDDIMNWIPARISGALLGLAALSLASFRVMLRDARKHRSPNAGWPEAAMAAGLGLALAGPRRYEDHTVDDPWINAAGRPDAAARDIRRAIDLIWRGWALALGLIVAMMIIIL